jgi:predicted amidophosphoribosyltransferase
MFKFSDVGALDSANNVLIVDENLTTGETINQIMQLLQTSAYSGKIDVFTLLSNR